MFRHTVLGSGSKGNALLVETSSVAVLVDVGFGTRALERRLGAAACAPERLSAIVLTHEHVDHACGALAAALRWNLPVYGSAGTIAAVRAMGESSERVTFRCLEHRVDIGDLVVTTHAVSHDASEPTALVIEQHDTGARLGVAIDLGVCSTQLADAFSGLDALVIESNHDEAMLRDGPYPAMLKRRISSRSGHLSNRQAAEFVGHCAHRGLRSVTLAHLSETNNAPDVALDMMRGHLAQRGWRGDIEAAPQRTVGRPVRVTRGSRSAAVPVQLQLSL